MCYVKDNEIKSVSGASRYRWRTAVQLPGLWADGGPLSPLLLLCHVVLPALHIHEPAWNRALWNVQPTPQLKPCPDYHPTQPTASPHQDQPPDFQCFLFLSLVLLPALSIWPAAVTPERDALVYIKFRDEIKSNQTVLILLYPFGHSRIVVAHQGKIIFGWGLLWIINPPVPYPSMNPAVTQDISIDSVTLASSSLYNSSAKCGCWRMMLIFNFLIITL